MKAAARKLGCRGIIFAAVVCSTLLLQGCAVASYELGVATMVEDMKVRQREDYETYRREAEAANAQRVASGQEARRPMTFRQWMRSQQGG